MSSILIDKILSESKVKLLIDSIKSDLLVDYPFLAEWKIDFDKAKRRAGVCKVLEKKISISLWHIKHNPVEVYKDTILHEFAHAISYELYKELGHGSVWKSVARSIGAVPKSTGRFSLPGSPWYLVYYDQANQVIEKLAPRYRRTKKIKNYFLKGRPETEGRLYFVCSEEYELYEQGLIPFDEINVHQ